MKTLKLIVIGMVLFLASAVQAQVSVSLNIGSPPLWGPAGYTDVRYYYLPDVQAYYDVQSSIFIYNSGGSWVRRANLPLRYRNYDLYSGYKVVMTDYRGNTPYTHFNEHKAKYAKGYHGQAQKTYGERPGKGNSRQRILFKGNSYNKVNQGNGQSAGHGNDKNIKKNHGNGGGNGKKK
ncbi:MAG: hypothetical protein WC865_16025 [Bacteroidales bacterium]